ncbi:MAG TPA: hypothetical protein PKA90_14020 [Ignavibacteria bacterium]|nr:hypothetical protein [Ignavibacteria bacterium]HMR41536.1 hypothetical protein [Ignavibacteria bacterium]
MKNKTDPWDISHLEEPYFKKIGLEAAGKYSLDVPIKLVFIGKTGETYNTPNVNPNWSAEMMDGKIIKYNSTRKIIIGSDHWTAKNCFIIEWDKIKNTFKNADDI